MIQINVVHNFRQGRQRQIPERVEIDGGENLEASPYRRTDSNDLERYTSLTTSPITSS